MEPKLEGHETVVNPNLHLPLPAALQGPPEAAVDETLDVVVELLGRQGAVLAGDDEVLVGEVVRVHVHTLRKKSVPVEKNLQVFF